MEVVLQTNLDVDECARRLEKVLGKGFFSGMDRGPLDLLFRRGRPPVRGRVTGDKFWLFRVRWFGNSFAPGFYGCLAPDSSHGGTRVEGGFRMHWFVKFYLTIWFATLLAFGILQAVYVVACGRHNGDLLFVAVPFGMAAMFLAVIFVGKWLGRGDEEYIVNFLRETLDASVTQRSE